MKPNLSLRHGALEYEKTQNCLMRADSPRHWEMKGGDVAEHNGPQLQRYLCLSDGKDGDVDSECQWAGGDKQAALWCSPAWLYADGEKP